jgi:surfactin synthase thioesterase subunit
MIAAAASPWHHTLVTAENHPQALAGTVNDLWFRRYAPAPGARVRLVCLPHAGGSASFYRPLARALGPAVDVAAVQYPGRQDRRRERCVNDIGVLADEVFAALRSWADRPIALFGHSMGAILGFELARRAEASGEVELVRLFASGRRAPSRRRDENVRLLDDDGLIAELRKLSGTDSRVLGDEEIMRLALPAIRADYEAVETYRYADGPKLRCPVTVLNGDADPKVTLDEAREWRAHTEAEMDFRVFPGGHFFLTDHQAAITALIAEQLA